MITFKITEALHQRYHTDASTKWGTHLHINRVTREMLEYIKGIIGWIMTLSQYPLQYSQCQMLNPLK